MTSSKGEWVSNRITSHRWVIVVVTVLVASVVVAPSSLASAAKKPVPMFYVSMGDSYAVGAEVGPGAIGGYASKVVTDVAPKHRLILRNFACSGATTTSLMSDIGCPAFFEAPFSVIYPKKTQLAAALSFIHAHHGRIGLITISIGGNDLGGTADNVPPIAANIATIATQLRAAAGMSVPIIGLTYPDVDLAYWLTGPSGVTTAEESVTSFQQIINPDWKAAYASANVTFVDITAAAGAYTPFTQLVDSPTYGEIPYAVAQICTLTGECSVQNEHPTNAGYTLIATQIVHAYRQLVS